MKEETVTIYTCIDGKQFDNERSAKLYEDILWEIHSIERNLPERPDNTDFANGHGYIQHQMESLRQARELLYDLALRVHPSMIEYDFFSYGFVRALDDSNSVLGKLYYRLVTCVDADLREWGQPYFANHPEHAKQVRLNGV